MKKIFAILLSILLILSFAGCAEVVSQEIEPVQAVLIDTHRRPATRAGKVMIPADYDLIFTYNNVEYNIDISRSIYYNHYKQIGDTFNMELVTTVYGDDTTEVILRFPGEAQ